MFQKKKVFQKQILGSKAKSSNFEFNGRLRVKSRKSGAKDQIRKSRETKFEIEFLMGFNLHKKFKFIWVHLENF